MRSPLRLRWPIRVLRGSRVRFDGVVRSFIVEGDSVMDRGFRVLAAVGLLWTAAACRSSNPSGDGSGSPAVRALAVTVQGPGTGRILGAGIAECRASCTTRLPAGTQLTLTAVADAASSFAGWTGDCTGQSECRIVLDSDRAVAATFSPLSPPPLGKHVVTVAKSGPGEVVSNPARIDCGSICSAIFDDGTALTFSAVADPGFHLAGFRGACTGQSCTLLLRSDALIEVDFEPGPPPPGTHTLRVTRSGSGAGAVSSSPGGIDCGSACSAGFPDGTQVTFRAAPSPGSRFAGWSGACSGTGACTMTVRADASLEAAFESLPPPDSHLVAEVSGPGVVGGGGLNCGNGASACDAALRPGTSVHLTATTAPAARFIGWGEACRGAQATCDLTVQGDTRLSARFEFEVQTLLPADGTVYSPYALALNSTHVFIGRRTSDGLGIWSIPKRGGPAARIAQAGQAYFLVADDGYVYWTDSSGLYSAPVGGGDASQISAGFILRMALDPEGALYWVDRTWGDRPPAIHRMQSRVDQVIATAQGTNVGIAVDASHVWFTNATSVPQYSIRRVPKHGGTVEVVLAIGGEAPDVRVDPGHVYWRESNGPVWAASRSDGSRALLSGDDGAFLYSEFDVNASVVWWIGVKPGTQGLRRANADGTGRAIVDEASAPAYYLGPRADDTAVYYFRSGALLRRLQ